MAINCAVELASKNLKDEERERTEWGPAAYNRPADILGVAVPFFFEGAMDGPYA